MKDQWRKEEAGWYAHPRHGSIQWERGDGGLLIRRGWYVWPLVGERRGPWKTLKEAKIAIERTSK